MRQRSFPPFFPCALGFLDDFQVKDFQVKVARSGMERSLFFQKGKQAVECKVEWNRH